MASCGHASLHMPHPTQAFSSRSLALAFIETGNPSGSVNPRQSKGHMSMHMEQAEHTKRNITGLGHSDLLTLMQNEPFESRRAPAVGQALPHTPHSMHLFLSITCLDFFSPETAPAGQSFAQEPQPVQFSVILYGTHGTKAYTRFYPIP